MMLTLDYGTTGLPFAIDGLNATVLRPTARPGLADEHGAFLEAVRAPLGEAKPLRACVQAGERVAIVIADTTRPLPSDRLLPWILGELAHVPLEQVTILSGTGSHRANTTEEWLRLVGEPLYRTARCIDHDAHEASTHALAGESPFGYPVYMNREYVEADRRIILGFIEPHFMAGFSGGYKAVFPGVAGIDAIMQYHGAENIGHPRSTWGCLEDNPTQATVRANGSLLPVDFCVNVTLNQDRAITGYFCGETLAAHARGCAYCMETAMTPVEQRYPVVVTTNSGFPLDQNLYQTVKGMSAAVQIVEPGGLILAAARCNDGFPAHGNFREFLFTHEGPEAMLEKIYSPGFQQFDQWQVQILAQILKRARVGLFSELDAEEVRRAHLEPVSDIRAAVNAELARIGTPDAPVAVLPEGPLTIPYVREG